jgi:phage antirepressor YoqD-like protein
MGCPVMKRQPYYTVKDIASALSVSEHTARRWLRTKGVAIDRLGNGWVVWHGDLMDRCATQAMSLGLCGDDEA